MKKPIASTNLELSGVHFTDGIDYTFPLGTFVSAGRFIVLVSNPTNYCGPNIREFISMAPTAKNLSNGGEILALAHASGTSIVSIAYGTRPPWPHIRGRRRVSRSCR